MYLPPHYTSERIPMQKQQLIHLHQLLDCVATELSDDLDENPTPEYEMLNVNPSAIHKSKASHKEAILTLGEEIEEALPEQETAQEVLV